jgi:ankyrin repeat protein
MVDEFDPAIFNIRDPRFNNKTIFHASCWCRDLETARFLLQHGADINAVDDAGMTPWLQTFLEPFTFFRGTVPDMKDEKDIPADMIIEIAQFLVSQGARLDFEVKDCPLLNRLEVMHYNANKPKLIDFLVRHGHPVDNYHPSFGTPLFCAAINRNVKSVKRLLRLGANPNIMVPGEKGDYDHLEPAIAKVMRDSHSTALVEAVAQDCVTIRSNLSGLETFELLLKHGATVYPRLGQIGWHDGSPMAHVFILRNRNDYLEVLLRYHSGFVLSRNAGGHTPLQVAAMARNLQAVQLLIDHGADLNARSFDGCTALLSAFGYRNDLEIEEQDSPEWREESLEIANILGANGADITARRSWRFAPPTRVFLDCDPEDVARSCAFTVSDDSLVNNWKMWIIRRK